MMAKRQHNSFLGWLGRQIGHVKKAATTSVPEVVYRKETVQHARIDGLPNQILRRTTVDEVIVDSHKNKDPNGLP